MDYADAVASLPIPTSEQTEKFAQHAADNHSWYKRLPFFPPGASFVFFPNPHAGRGVRKSGERFEVFDIEPGNYFDHHSRLSTAEYRSRFGYWDYWVDDNPRVAGSEVGPLIYGLGEGPPERLPDQMKRSWACRLTAFLNPSPSMFSLQPERLDVEKEAFAGYARRHPTDPAVIRCRAVIRQLQDLREPALGDHALWPLLNDEARAQRDLLTATLRRTRKAWKEQRQRHD